MKLIKPTYEILTPINGKEVLKTIEKVARTCYKSEDKISDDSAEKMVKNLISRGHEAMLEFYDVTVKFTCDRGVSHEIVRHRMASYAQESTRYCNYGKDKFDNQITFIIPEFFPEIQEGNYWVDNWDTRFPEIKTDVPGLNPSHIWIKAHSWLMAMLFTEKTYLYMVDSLDNSLQPQQARAVLPNSLKTEINAKYNIREWRHFFRLRCAPAAHPQMRELTLPLLKEFKAMIPILFDDINFDK